MTQQNDVATVVVTKQHAEVAVAIYAGTDLAADLAGDPEMLESTAEMVAFFQRDAGYLPREADELDAYANSTEEWAAYQAAHPAPAGAAKLPVAVDKDGPCHKCGEECHGELDDAGLCVACLSDTPEHKAATAAALVAQAKAAAASVDVDALLKRFSKACRSAAHASLDMGETAVLYINGRMALSESVTRANCTTTLMAKWAEYADETVTVARVNALIRLYQASVAFPMDAKAKRPALCVYKAFSQCLARNEAGRSESWAVLDGLDGPMTGDAAKDAYSAAAAFHDAVTKGLTGTECESVVKTLLERRDAALVAAKKAAAEATAKAAAKAKAEQAAAEQQKAAAENAAREAEKAAAAPAAADVKAVLTAAAQQAQQEAAAAAALSDSTRLAAEKAAQTASLALRQQQIAVQAQVEADAKKAVAEQKKADKTAAKSKPAVDAGAPNCTQCQAVPSVKNGRCAACDAKSNPAPKAPAGCGEVNLLAAAVASKGAPKDVADLVVGMIAKTTAPDDVLLYVVQALKAHKDVSKPTQRACAAFLAALTAPAVNVPLPVAAAANGVVAAA